MRPTIHSPPALRSLLTGARTASASALAELGPGHPLVEAVCSFRAAQRRVAELACVQLLGIPFALDRSTFANLLELCAALVQVALLVQLAEVRVARRRCCLEHIAAGGGCGAISAVEREWRRLADPRTRSQLADLAERIADPTALAGDLALPGPPLVQLPVVAAAAPQLRDAAKLLRAERPAVPGVALAELLLRFGDSPLYGGDSELLRRTLGRLRFTLTSGR